MRNAHYIIKFIHGNDSLRLKNLWCESYSVCARIPMNTLMTIIGKKKKVLFEIKLTE